MLWIIPCLADVGTKLSSPFGQEMSGKCLNFRALFRAVSLGAITFLGLHGAAWLWSVGRLTLLIDQEADRLRSQGWRIQTGAARYGGWPGQARVEVGPATISAHGMSVRAESLSAEAFLVRPGPLTWRSRGHALRLGLGAERPLVTGDVTGEELPDGVLLSTAATRVAGLFAVDALRVWMRPNETNITLQRLRSLNARGALGPTIEAIELRVEAHPPTAPVAGSQSSTTPEAEGDNFDVELMHSTAAGMNATGRARIQFDAALGPRLDGVIHVTGYAAGLDRLAATELIPSATAVAAKAVLGLLATPPDGAAEIPVRIESGILYAAQFALLRLPRAEGSGLEPLR